MHFFFFRFQAPIISTVIAKRSGDSSLNLHLHSSNNRFTTKPVNMDPSNTYKNFLEPQRWPGWNIFPILRNFNYLLIWILSLLDNCWVILSGFQVNTTKKAGTTVKSTDIRGHLIIRKTEKYIQILHFSLLHFQAPIISNCKMFRFFILDHFCLMLDNCWVVLSRFQVNNWNHGKFSWYWRPFNDQKNSTYIKNCVMRIQISRWDKVLSSNGEVQVILSWTFMFTLQTTDLKQ